MFIGDSRFWRHKFSICGKCRDRRMFTAESSLVCIGLVRSFKRRQKRNGALVPNRGRLDAPWISCLAGGPLALLFWRLRTEVEKVRKVEPFWIMSTTTLATLTNHRCVANHLIYLYTFKSIRLWYGLSITAHR